MDRFIGHSPKTEIIDGMFFIHCGKRRFVLPISAARRMVERASRQLDQFDAQAGRNVSALPCGQGKRRRG